MTNPDPEGCPGENRIHFSAWFPGTLTLEEKGACPQQTSLDQPLLLGSSVQFSSVQSLSWVQLFVTPWTAACQASLSNTNSRSLLKFMSIESVMPSKHLILCHPLLLPPSIFPSIRVFSKESVLRIRWPKNQFQLQHQSFQ